MVLLGLVFVVCSCERTSTVGPAHLGDNDEGIGLGGDVPVAIFDVEDILSFDMETGEIEFIDLSFDSVCDSLEKHVGAAFYLYDKRLFTVVIYWPEVEDRFFDMGLYVGDGRLFLTDVRPGSSSSAVVDGSINVSILDPVVLGETWQQMWGQFVEYLESAGRLKKDGAIIVN
jgi:hypothetical protein